MPVRTLRPVHARERKPHGISGSAPTMPSRAPVRRWISGQARRSTGMPLRGSWRPTKTRSGARGRPASTPPAGSGRRSGSARSRPGTSSQPMYLAASGDRDPVVDPLHQEAPGRPARCAASRGRRRRGRSPRPDSGPTPTPRVQTTESSARAGGARRTVPARAPRLIRGIAAGLRMTFGSAPFAGTITERPIGITSAGGRAVPPIPPGGARA